MVSGACTYDCLATSEELQSNPDISGIGVILGSTITAGLSVLLVVFYYVFAFCLEDGRPTSSQISGTPDRLICRSNAIDALILRLIRRKRSNSSRCRWYDRADDILAPSVLIVSDLQLLSGLSLLISGFTQLPCGLSAYHWQKLVYLVWFASITHLACLTLLCRYFTKHSFKRLWRLIAMGTLIVLLVVAMLPTSQFHFHRPDYRNQRPLPSDPAICYYSQGPWKTKEGHDGAEISRQYMVLSAALLGGGMLIRFIRLHQTPTRYLGAVREFCSRKSRNALRITYKYSRGDELISRLKRAFWYNPLLAGFLVLRTLVDFWSSMAFEVWWLIVSFVWGIIRLWWVSQLPSGWNDSESQEWTFGQVLPLLLLLSPIIAGLETWNPVEQNEPPSPDASDIVQGRVSISELPFDESEEQLKIDSEHPDFDFYSLAWMNSYMLLFAFVVLALSSLLLWLVYQSRMPFVYLFSLQTVQIDVFLCLFWFIVFSLHLESSYRVSKGLQRLSRALLLITLFTLFIGGSVIYQGVVGAVLFYAPSVHVSAWAMYIVAIAIYNYRLGK